MNPTYTVYTDGSVICFHENMGRLRELGSIFSYPRNSGQDPWPEGTELKLVSGKALGFESIELDAPAWTPDPWIHKKTRKPTKMESYIKAFVWGRIFLIVWPKK